MDLLKKAKRWTLGLTLALAAIAPGATAHAGELPEAANTQLAKVAQLRQAGKPAEAIVLLESLAKETRQQPEAGAAVQYVLADTYDRDLKDTKRAHGIYGRLALAHANGAVEIPGLGSVDIQQESLKRQDAANRDHWLYKVMESITAVISDNPVTGRMLASHSGVLAILLLTFLVKLALTPLTVKSFRSMREMQKLQPLMKDLQQRYKDKPQELNMKMMELYKEHGVNPVSGCLPMLLQMPIIILLYRAIGLYQYPLSHESFLWIKSLAMGDLPLAVIYALSLYVSSKLTVMPTTDPQQEQQQKMMALMMPLLFFFMFKSYPAGFIFGWLSFNVLTTAQQWHIMRGHLAEEAAGAVINAPALSGNGGARKTVSTIKRKKNAASSPRR